MAYDKVIDSTVLEEGLTAIANKIREKGGTTDILLFPDEFVSAIDAIGTSPTTKILYELTPSFTNTSLSSSNWNNRTWYKSFYNSGDGWIGVDGISVTVFADVSSLPNRYMYNSQTNTMYFCVSTSPSSFTASVHAYDLSTSLDTYEKVETGTHNNEYPSGTYVTTGDSWNYYG